MTRGIKRLSTKRVTKRKDVPVLVASETDTGACKRYKHKNTEQEKVAPNEGDIIHMLLSLRQAGRVSSSPTTHSSRQFVFPDQANNDTSHPERKSPVELPRLPQLFHPSHEKHSHLLHEASRHTFTDVTRSLSPVYMPCVHPLQNEYDRFTLKSQSPVAPEENYVFYRHYIPHDSPPSPLYSQHENILLYRDHYHHQYPSYPSCARPQSHSTRSYLTSYYHPHDGYNNMREHTQNSLCWSSPQYAEHHSELVPHMEPLPQSDRLQDKMKLPIHIHHYDCSSDSMKKCTMPDIRNRSKHKQDNASRWTNSESTFKDIRETKTSLTAHDMVPLEAPILYSY
jgi:hypothetical protein